MAAKRPTAQRRTAARRKKLAPRKSAARRPARGGFMQRQALRMGHAVGRQAEKRTSTVTSRKDAAILRITHEGCPKCKGNGQIYTKKKDGSFAGSKPCPAKPTRQKASRLQVALAARFGPDKNSGLMGWTCPCGSKEKPKYRDAKVATAALRTHERRKHGGQTVGGTWYAQVAEGATTVAEPKRAPLVTKADTSGSTMTDAQWEAQNARMSPKTADRKGVCWQCGGKGSLYSAFAGERITAVCPSCTGTGKPAVTAGA